LYGIDAPEPGDICGADAIDALVRLLTDNGRGWQVRVEFGSERFEGETALAYLWVGDPSGEYLLDEQMVWYGYAHAVQRDGRHYATIWSAQDTAYANRHGCLWSRV
jgi:endonuclease YncB( thermonuclease family)